MNRIYLALGVFLLAVTIVDLCWTTLWVEGGAGPITSRLMAWTWRTLRLVGRTNPRLQSLSGVVIFALTLTVWILLLWVGWTLLFASAGSVLIDTLNRGAISWADRFYFTGYTMFTLGTGDFVPQEGRWQLVTVLVAASGLLFVTLSVTYSLSVLDAVTQKRAFASSVSGLGTQSEDIVRRSWNGTDFQEFDSTLSSFVTQLTVLTENHNAYPVLHYFHSAHADRAPVMEIAALDEALTIFLFGIPEQDCPNEIVLRTARISIQHYLETINKTFVDPAEQTPPQPSLEVLRDAGVPTCSDEQFAAALEELSSRRRILLGLVESDARRWPSSGSS